MIKILQVFKKHNIISACISTFIVVVALYCYLFYSGDTAEWLRNPLGSDLLWLAVGYGCYKVIQNGLTADIKYFKTTTFLLSLFFAITIVIGHAFTLNGSLDMYSSSVGLVLFLLVTTGFTLLFFSILVIVYAFLDKYQITALGDSWIYKNTKRTFYIIWGSIFAYYSIYLIMLFPGVITFDSVVEINQYTSGAYTNHHPYIHVKLIHIMLSISEFFGGSMIAGIFMYAFLQMFIIAGIFAYAISFSIEKRVNKMIILILLIYYGLLPLHAVYSITMWKDILFSGICLLIVIQLLKLIYYADELKNKSCFIYLGVLLFLFSTLRNNGFYAFVLFIPAVVFLNKNYRRPLMLMCTSVFMLVMTYTNVLLPSLDVKKGSIGEALSVPLQQIARTVKYHGDELTMDEKIKIRQLFDTDSIGFFYKSHISDFVKGRFNEKVFNEDSSTYLNLWATLFVKYPKVYIESFIAGSYGYIDPSVNYGGAYAFTTIADYEQEGFAIASTNLKNEGPPGKSNILLATPLLMFIHIPLISLFTSIGMMIWIALILLVRCLNNKDYKILTPFLFLTFLYLTLLASPVYAEFRYAYGIVISIPIMCCIVLLNQQKEIKSNVQNKGKTEN